MSSLVEPPIKGNDYIAIHLEAKLPNGESAHFLITRNTEVIPSGKEATPNMPGILRETISLVGKPQEEVTIEFGRRSFVTKERVEKEGDIRVNEKIASYSEAEARKFRSYPNRSVTLIVAETGVVTHEAHTKNGLLYAEPNDPFPPVTVRDKLTGKVWNGTEGKAEDHPPISDAIWMGEKLSDAAGRKEKLDQYLAEWRQANSATTISRITPPVRQGGNIAAVTPAAFVTPVG